MPERTGRLAMPFTTFNFKVVFSLDDRVLCDAAFAECDGLEMTMEPKTYQEGGNNLAQVHLVGPITYGQLSLKRGMTHSLDLWQWFDRVVHGETELRVNGQVVMLGSRGAALDQGEGEEEIEATFYLSRCLPIKLKAPALNAKEGAVAIEEMQVAYERLKIIYPPQEGAS
jgi:phage tail-like protein